MGIQDVFKMIKSFVESVDTMTASSFFQLFFVALLTLVAFYGATLFHKIATFEIERIFSKYKEKRTPPAVNPSTTPAVDSPNPSPSEVTTPEPTSNNNS